MELLGISTIIAYAISTFGIKYVLIEEEQMSYRKTFFDITLFLSLVFFSAYTYSLIDSFYQKFNFNEADFLGAETYSKCSMSIPLYPGLKREQQIKVRDIMGEFLK